MEPRNIDRLSERQKAILRLVLWGHGSKSIARELGVSSHTIDGNMRDALKLLRVGDRKEAARLLAEAEASNPQPLIPQPVSVADADPPALSPPLAAPGWSGDDRRGEEVMEERIPFPWPERPDDDRRAEGRRRNRLTVARRLTRIARTAAAIVGAFASIAFAMFLLQRLFQALSFPSP